MESTSLRFDTLNTLLSKFINDFMNTYKAFLIRDNKKASGNLIDSIREYAIVYEGDNITAEISLASYWKYVEYGRKPGRFPPIQNIYSWIDKKPVMPRPIKGLKAPSRKQLAYLVARKIAREGIKPGNQMQEAMNVVWERWKDKISAAIDEDIQIFLST